MSSQPLDARGELLPVRVQARLVGRPRQPPTAIHEHVEVRRERNASQPPATVRPEYQPFQVLLVDIAMSEAHRLPTGGPHRQQRGGMVIGVEQRNLAADELRMSSWAAQPPEQPHLSRHMFAGMATVDADPVGISGVIAGSARQIATREDAVRPLAANSVPAQHLAGRTNTSGQFIPTATQRLNERRIGSCGALD